MRQETNRLGSSQVETRETVCFVVGCEISNDREVDTAWPLIQSGTSCTPERAVRVAVNASEMETRIGLGGC